MFNGKYRSPAPSSFGNFSPALPLGGVVKPRIEVGKVVLRIPIRPSRRWYRLLVVVLVEGDLVLQLLMLQSSRAPPRYSGEN